MDPILTAPQLEALRVSDPARYVVESDRERLYANGFAWGRGIKTTHTIKGSQTALWKRGQIDGKESLDSGAKV
jgi:hypothetical protein